MELEEKQKLYIKAKEAYYTGEPIMSDQEFDTIEKEIGLENKGDIGLKSMKYNATHPFLMGSLSKIQVKYEKGKTGVEWSPILESLYKYLDKSKDPNGCFVVEPKFDGCSFELLIDLATKEIIQVSTRGNGTQGLNITSLFLAWLNEYFKNGSETVYDYIVKVVRTSWATLGWRDYQLKDSKLCIRGEILCKKKSIDEINSSVSKPYSSPRSFVAGMTGCKFEELKEEQKRLVAYLNFLAYDFRIIHSDGEIEEFEYFNKDYFPIEVPTYRQLYSRAQITEESFKFCYDAFDEYRKVYEYPLDGFVIKPIIENRNTDINIPRQKDQVAIKFLPEIKESTLIDIKWKLGRTGEWFPTGVIEPIFLQEKEVSRISLHGYSTLKTKKVGIGSKVKVSMAGDIIPFLYEVETNSLEWNLPLESVVVEEDGTPHLMTLKDLELFKSENSLYDSMDLLKIPGIGPKLALKISESFKGEFKNILELMNPNGYEKIINKLGNSKTICNAISALNSYSQALSLDDIIYSMSIPGCGKKASEACAIFYRNYHAKRETQPSVFLGLSSASYEWIFDINSNEFKMLEHLIEISGVNITTKEEKEGKIKVILTGKPPVELYKDKKDFIKKNPQYEETSRWNECQILFTDSLESNSGKMKKAKSNNIRIELYENANK